MRTGNDQVGLEFRVGVVHYARRHICHGCRVDMGLNANAGRKRPGSDRRQIASGLLNFREVMLFVNLSRRPLLDHVQEHDVGIQLLRKERGRLQGGLGELRSIEGDKDVLEHGYPPFSNWESRKIFRATMRAATALITTVVTFWLTNSPIIS